MRTAKKFTSNPDYLQKLISAGNVGLVVAVDRFDIGRVSRFLTYAAWWINKEILDEMSASSSPVHVPAYLQKQMRKDAKEGKYVCINCGLRSHDRYGHTELPDCCDETHEFLPTTSTNSQMLGSPLPLDNLELSAPGDTFTGVLEQRTGVYLRRTLAELHISERDRFIVLGFFGAGAGDRKNGSKKLPQLSEITGITTERVRQIKERIILRLKGELRRKQIESVRDAY
jgi:RNA polymerase sigma factor (sigma-70 family)